MMDALKISNVSFSYVGEQHSKQKDKVIPVERTLQNVSLTVRQGCCMCLMGINGCGKSTLLDCVLGEHKPAEGEILIFGANTERLSANQRAQKVAYVAQMHEKSFPYSVTNVVLMGASIRNDTIFGPDLEDEDIAREFLTRCGVEHLADRIYTSLSGGEMQMVMLARALAQQTPIIVMDEPTAHLDFRNELLFLETIEELNRKEGVTVLMATHSPNQAFHLKASGVDVEVAVMHEGSIAVVGDPNEVLNPKLLRDVFGVESMVVKERIEGCSSSDHFSMTTSTNFSNLNFESDCISQIIPLKSTVDRG